MILILNCDIDKDLETNGAHILSRYIESCDTIIKDIFEMDFPTINDMKSSSGIIITGSRKSVYESDEWVDKLLREIRTIDSLGIPTLGICFGFQAIAKALGGTVQPSGYFQEGFMPIEIYQNNPLFSGLPNSLMVYHSHGDIVSTYPPNSNILARDLHSVQAYSVNNFLCVQFHPEITAKIALKMAARDGKNTDKILNGVPTDYDLPSHILKNFLSYCTNE